MGMASISRSPEYVERKDIHERYGIHPLVDAIDSFTVFDDASD